MLPVLHPLAKTAIEARRAIHRLEVFVERAEPGDPLVSSAKVIITKLKSVRKEIPEHLVDVDLY